MKVTLNAKAIKHYLIRQDLRQEQLAEKIGLSPSAFSTWMTGKQRPTINTLVLMSRLMEMHIDELLIVEEESAGGEDLEEERAA
jgi:transcriptional regulator with XRE-family HTH domain